MPKRFAFPIIAILLVFAAYSAYWFYARAQIDASLNEWADQQEAAGFEVEAENLAIGGFPFRFQIKVDALSVTAPEEEGGWSWQVNESRANALPYDFNHWIVDVGSDMRLENEGTGIRILTESIQFSLASQSEAEFRIGAALTGVVLEPIGDIETGVGQIAGITFNAIGHGDGEMQMRIRISDADLNEAEIDPILASSFGTHMDLVLADLIIENWESLMHPKDITRWAGGTGSIDIVRSAVTWGRLNVTADGNLALDDELRPDGRLSLYLLDPEAVADALIEAGAVQGDAVAALRLFAQTAPRSEQGTAIPLSFRRGGVYFGPVRLGEVGSIAGGN